MPQYIIYGLGKTGIATANFLLKKDYQIIIHDDNNKILQKTKTKLTTNKQNIHIAKKLKIINWQNIKYLVISPGIDIEKHKNHFIVKGALQNKCPIITDIELFYIFHSQAKFIGITGTNGKSTTTALTEFILQNNNINIQCGGNIGTACFELKEINKNDSYLFELSSFQLDLIKKARFSIASLLNITRDHLDRHGSMNNYIKAKKRIFLNQKKDDFSIINIDQHETLAIYNELINDINFKATIIPASNETQIKDGFSLIDDYIFYKNQKIFLGKVENLAGEHNKQNILFSFIIAKLHNISNKNAITAIRQFSGLKHRMHLYKKISNINFINDSKATNVAATEKALKNYDNIYWIVGGRAKKDNILDLEKYFPKITQAFLIGESSVEFANLFKNKIKFSQCKTLEKAFLAAYDTIKVNSNRNTANILLSPACSSFDQWKNFEERGEYFYKLVNSIQK